MKAMILAAGYGSRLGDVTKKLPKPLIQLGQYSIIEHQVLNLKKSGFEDIIINISYLAEQIQNKLKTGNQYGVNINYSIEKQPLETGGGIKKALGLLGSEPFVCVNSDIYTDYDFGKLKTKLQNSNYLGHLVLVNNPIDSAQGDFDLDNNLLNLNKKFTYSGIAVYHPDLIKNNKQTKFSIVPSLIKNINNKKISGELYTGQWFEMGNIKRLEQARAFIEKEILS